MKKKQIKTKKKCRHKWELTEDNDCVYCGFSEFFVCEKCGAEKEIENGKVKIHKLQSSLI